MQDGSDGVQSYLVNQEPLETIMAQGCLRNSEPRMESKLEHTAICRRQHQEYEPGIINRGRLIPSPFLRLDDRWSEFLYGCLLLESLPYQVGDETLTKTRPGITMVSESR